MDKKIVAIIILSLIIIGLVVFIIIPGDDKIDPIIEQIRIQRNELIRTTGIIELELNKSLGETAELKEDNIRLESENSELGNIITELTTGSEKTEGYLSEYGRINSDLAEFIRQEGKTD